MASVATQAGRLSQFQYAKQSGLGVPNLTPDHRVNHISFDYTEDLGIIVFNTLNGVLDEVVESRLGVETLGGTGQCPAYTNQPMGLIKANYGNAIVSGGGDTSFTALSANTAVGDESFQITGPLPAVPSGMPDWRGAFLDITTGGVVETVPVFAVADGTPATIYTWPLKKVHTAADVVTHKRAVGLLGNTGANADQLDWLTLFLRYGTQAEVQLPDAQVSEWKLTGDNEKLTHDFKFITSAPLTETESLTAIATGTGEANDSPLIMRDGGVASFFTDSDTVPKQHDRLTALDFSQIYAVNQDKVGGGTHDVALSDVSGRTYTCTWTELTGQKGKTNGIHQLMVEQVETPVIFAWVNKKNGRCFSIVIPRACFTMYKRVGPTNATMAYDAAIQVYLDIANSGFSAWSYVRNGVFSY